MPKPPRISPEAQAILARPPTAKQKAHIAAELALLQQYCRDIGMNPDLSVALYREHITFGSAFAEQMDRAREDGSLPEELKARYPPRGGPKKESQKESHST